MTDFDPARLSEDVAAKPELVASLAAVAADDPWELAERPRRVLLVGMGSSYFAASAVARRLRRHGVTAVAERASVEASWPPTAGDLVVAISAGGASAETLRAAEPYADSPATLVALTNAVASPLAGLAHRVVAMDAGVEVSGVSVRSFVATLVRLLQLDRSLAGGYRKLPARVAAAASAAADLLAGAWVDDAVAELAGPDGTWLLAPAERLSSALQGALMLREVPRRAADGCETGDWSHVDVYLTNTLDYRAVVFAGSPWDAAATDWMTRRGSTFWSIGGALTGARRVLRYAGDEDPVVALLAETTVPELLAARLGPR